MDVNLTLEQRRQLEQALLDSFDVDSLNRMLILELGMQLQYVANVANRKPIIINELVSTAIQEEWVDRLVIGAYRDRPVSRLEKILQELKIIVPEKSVKQSETVSVNEVPSRQNLERLVNSRSNFSNLRDFNKRLEELGTQVCRIEIPKGTAKGTGWLVGPDLILTAYHVVEGIIPNNKHSKQIYCRFDYGDDLSEANISNGVGCGVAEDWLIDSSPYAEMDIGNSSSNPTMEELDYALIRLDSPIGNEILPSGKNRGWMKISEMLIDIRPDDLMLIVQHPKGRPLEIAFGNVLSKNSNGTRFRYDTNTEPGSSGAPCFDINLIPFGIHHASGPSENLLFNQCVPLVYIIDQMKRKAKPKFWSDNY